MDPNANLEAQRRLAADIINGNADAEKAARLAELVVALDGWLCSGGFLPHTWLVRK